MSHEKDDIKKALTLELPGVDSHVKLLPPGKVLTAAPYFSERVKHSSVLVLLFNDDDNLKVILIKRPSHMKHHAGQIAFPGGRIEQNETTEETALRETCEEIGIKSNKIEILGRLSDFYVEVSRFQIHPVVGWLHSKPAFRINSGEVEKVLCFPVLKFRPPFDLVSLETPTGRLDVPCIKYDEEIIWGATAMILSEFIDALKKADDTISGQS